MSILGTCLISVVFLPVDKIFAVKVRVVDQLPLGLILGTAFMRRYESSSLRALVQGGLSPPRQLLESHFCPSWSGQGNWT